jgi:two-component sensor histidine kinase/sensor domain CHASE-containing protein
VSIARSLPARILATAALYFVAGRLALLMAIPPGYATACWPAAGLALACMLVGGAGVWPGVVFGSFLVNVGTAFDDSTPAAAITSYAVAISIGLGAGLQAGVGAALVRRFVGYPGALDRDRDIARFLLIAGPVSCLASATWGVTSLLVASRVPPAAYGLNWATWFVGDTIGSVLFAPVALTFLGEPREAWRRRRQTVAMPLAIGFTAVTLLFVRASRWEKERLDAEFANRANGLAHALERQLHRTFEVGSSVASLYQTDPAATRGAFREFTRHALSTHPGIQAIEWIPRVTRDERRGYEAAAVAEGFSGFAFRETSPAGALVSAAPRDVYFPVYYVEPVRGNERALGYDLASDPSRRATLFAAADAASARATPPLTLVQERGDQRGVLVVSPTYESGAILETPEQRRSALRGFSVCVFRVGTIVASAFSGLDRRGIMLRLADVSPSGESHLYADPPGGQIEGRWSTHFEVGGRRWRAEFSTSGGAEADRSWQAWFVLAGGLFFVGLLEAVLLIVTGRDHALRDLSRDLEARVVARTRELDDSLREKDVLLQEIHHRVRNSLQVISSLLSLQARQLPDPRAAAMLAESQSRVRSIARVHEHLYRSKDRARVDFEDYVRGLVEELVAQPPGPSHVSTTVAVESLRLPVDVAVPCGLIIHELVTNSLKHAFPGGRRGALRVMLRRAETDLVELRVEDDGIGLPAEVDPRQSTSLGLELISAFARQLQARVEVRREGGTSFCFTFPSELPHPA